MKQPRLVLLASLGLVCIVLAFVVHGYFMIGAAILSGLGWKEYYRKEKSEKTEQK